MISGIWKPRYAKAAKTAYSAANRRSLLLPQQQGLDLEYACREIKADGDEKPNVDAAGDQKLGKNRCKADQGETEQLGEHEMLPGESGSSGDRPRERPGAAADGADHPEKGQQDRSGDNEMTKEERERTGDRPFRGAIG